MQKIKKHNQALKKAILKLNILNIVIVDRSDLIGIGSSSGSNHLTLAA